MLKTLDKPRDALIPFDEKEQSNYTPKKPILLEHYHFLPSESAPELIIFYDLNEKSWFCESVAEASISKIADGELLKFSQSMWQLIKGADISEKETLAIDGETEQKFNFCFQYQSR